MLAVEGCPLSVTFIVSSWEAAVTACEQPWRLGLLTLPHERIPETSATLSPAHPCRLYLFLPELLRT